MALAAALLSPVAPAAAVPPDPEGPTTLGIYANTVHYNKDPQTTRGWKIKWRIPGHTNQALMAVGQWYFGFESGVYYTPNEGWWVYYYGDDDGLTGNNPDCMVAWDVGGQCTGAMANLPVGKELTFTYQWCNASFQASTSGTYNCVWVDLHDGVGNRFLAGELRTGQTVEMYTHEVETFGDSGLVQPIIPCNTPVVMLGQQVRSSSGAWSNLTGNQWNFHDSNFDYSFQNVNTAANPGRWEACSEGPPPSPCPTAWSASTLYATGDEVGFSGRTWRARWWNYGEQPGSGGAWEDLGAC
jgi:hypothetical protein